MRMPATVRGTPTVGVASVNTLRSADWYLGGPDEGFVLGLLLTGQFVPSIWNTAASMGSWQELSVLPVP
jgi:hypothetical protein